MREIKFRIWDGKRICPIDLYWFEEEMIKEWPQGSYSVKNTVLMQFTGLYDYQNNEIYEGDIVAKDGEKKNQYFGEVRWADDGFYIDWNIEPGRSGFAECAHRGQLKIIGNVYANPDLLNAL